MRGRPIIVALGILGALTLAVFAVMLPTAHPDATTQGAKAAEIRVEGGGSTTQETTSEGEGEGEGPARSTNPAPEVTAAPPEVAPRGSLLVTVVWPDGDPAPGVMVIVNTWQPLHSLAGHRATDDAGTVRFEGLTPGRGWVSTGFAGSKQCTIKAGEQASVRVELEGVAVRGTVVDAAGVGVAGAGIWLTSGRYDWLGGTVVATSDAEGGFALRCVPAGQSLGALAAGFEPSPLVDLDDLDTAEVPVRVRLVVSNPGGAIIGTVTTRAGAPVAGADVCVGVRPRRFTQRTGASGHREAWTPLTAHTDAEGRFALRAVTPGKHPFAVRATGHPIHKGEVEARPGARTRLDIELPAGVTVHGLVTDKAGAAIAGAVVRGYDGAVDESYIQGGQFNYESVFGFPFTSADAAGRFRLTGVAPGAVHLYATHPGHVRMAMGQAVVRAQVVLQAEDGADLEWNPVLDPGATITGVVTYRDGSPMSTFLNLCEVESGARQAQHSGRDGHFAFVNLRTVEYTVDVQSPFDAPAGAAKLEQKGVWPGGGELRLVAAYDSPNATISGSVRGRVDDAAHRHQAAGPIEVELRSSRGWRTAWLDSAGTFAFERIPPGRYRLTATSGEAIIYSGVWFELGPAQEYAAGTLLTEPGGDLLLRLPRRPGTEKLDVRLFARHQTTQDFRTILPGRREEYVVRNLSPGRYELHASTEGLAVPVQVVEVLAGQRAELEVVLRTGVLQRFGLAFATPPEPGDFDYEIRGKSGVVFARGQLKLTESSPNPFPLTARLPAGRGTIAAKTSTGLVGTREFEIGGSTERPPAIRVTMGPAK